MTLPAGPRPENKTERADETRHDERFGHLPWLIAHEREVAAIRELVAKIKPERVLDIAAGPGRIARNVHVPFGIAVDPSALMIRAAAMAVPENWRFVRADADALPFPDSTFDLACCFRFLRHNFGDERKKILAEIRRVIAGGGRLAFDVLNAKAGEFAPRFASLDEKRTGDPDVEPRMLRAEMEDAGFIIESLSPVMQHLRTHHIANIEARRRFLKRARKRLLRLGEKIPSKYPFGWIAVARKP